MKHLELNINIKELDKIKFSKRDQMVRFKELPVHLKKDLKLAVIMKNTIENAVGVIFKSKRHGVLRVNSPILMYGAKYLVVRGGRSIPLGSLLKLEF